MKTFFAWLKKRAVSGLLILLLLILIFNPNAKAFLLKQLISTGLFSAEIEKNNTNNYNYPVNAYFNFTDSEGKLISTTDLKGHVVFINFWASWCPPCRAEMPSLESLYKKLKNDDRFVFVFINEDEDKTKAKNYLEEYHYTFPLSASSGNVPNELFNGSLPTTVVINKEGKIVLKHEGMAGYDTEAFIVQLKELL